MVSALILLLSLGIVGCSSASPAEPAPATTSAPAVQQQAQPTIALAEPVPATTSAPAEPEASASSRPEAQATTVTTATTVTSEATTVSQPTLPPATNSEPDQSAGEESSAIATPESITTSAQATAPAAIADLPAATPVPEQAGGGYVIGEGSKATFTVNETLAWLDLPVDAVMHTSGISGSIYLDEQPSVIELDLHSMTSDSDRRDGYVKTRMFPDHRTATFTVTDLGEVPDPLPEGEVITREVPGELNILGVTKPIVFEIEARLDPGKLFVVGRTTFTWDELEIPPPNIPGRIQVKDEVRVEVLLAATPAEG